jgi:CRP-like cAMP-binding protein
MAQGTGGDECYLIVTGEVRLEVERPDFDSDGVIAYLGPGMLCGEFSLLDGRPRSASAYAHTEVTALALSQDGLARLCADDPPTGLAVLRALGRDAAAKARQTSRHLEEYVFAADIDPGVDETVARAAAAQPVLAGWPEDRVEALLTAVAEAVAARAGELAAATVAETGQGLEVCKALLARQGAGHTAVIHTADPALQRRFAEEVPASRILVNGPASHGCIGVGNGLTPSLTLGCGTFGGNSTTDNVTYTNLLNIKRLARPFI